MQLGMIGLGRMGGNMTTRLERAGHDVKTYDPGVESTAASLEELRDQLDAPRAFWMMVPAGDDHRGRPSRSCCRSPSPATRSSTAATRTSATRSAALRRRPSSGVHFVDAGVSGGVWGLEVGYCLMVGGDDARGRRGSSRSSPRSRPRTATRTSAGRAPGTS